ncbi:MAG: UDP-3-O-acyl-N-acetylglucosamine deacetylase [Fimbriiglobus sp.]
MRRIGYRQQRTLACPAEVRGVGFVTGARVRVRFLPAAADTGVVFVRTDLPGRPATPALTDRVTGTNRRTTLGSPNTGVTLVEHVLAALAGLRIDNCRIEIDGPEPPGLDGSSAGFVDALTAAGATLQVARRPIWAVSDSVIFSQSGATVGLHPPEPGRTGLRISYILDYGPQAPIPRQSHTLAVCPESFTWNVASCRTFLLEREVEMLHAQGVGRHLSMTDVLVFGPRGPIHNTLRFADEPARHKVLDLVGDLALCGFDLAGHVVAYRSGHSLNTMLATALAARAAAVDEPAAAPARVYLRRRAA